MIRKIVALMLMLSIALGLAAMPGAAVATEGPGFALPEEAAIAYLEGLRDQDFDRMLSAFAVESLAERYDMASFVGKVRSYAPVFEMRLPNAGDFARRLNAESRRAALTNAIVGQFMYYNTPAALNEYQPSNLPTPEEQAAFLAAFEAAAQHHVFADLQVTGVKQPLDILGEDKMEGYQRGIAGQLADFGLQSDDLAEIGLAFEADGRSWLFLAQAVRLNDRWYLKALSGVMGAMMGVGFAQGGLITDAEE